MKPLSAILVFATILLSSFLSSIDCYKMAEKDVINDLNQALAQTLEQKQGAEITPDTISSYRSFLTIPMLREHASMNYCMSNDNSDVVCSDTMTWHEGQQTVNFKGYANCSFATIFSMSNQSLPASLSAIAMMWALFCGFYFRRRHSQVAIDIIKYGGISYNAESNSFLDARQKPLRLTPMQHQLMQMFWTSESHQLSQKDICDALWPKKDDPSETLYTLIRRLKPTIENNSRIKIESDRGRGYRLTM